MSDAAPPLTAPPRTRVFPNLRETLLLLLVFLATTVLAAVVLRPLRQGISEQLWFFLVVLVGEGVGVLCGLRLARWPLRRVLGTLGFSVLTLRSLVVIGAGNLLLVGSLLYALAQAFGPVEEGYLLRLFSVRNAGEFLILFLTITVLAPLVEEVLVRGILLRGLTFSWGVRGGVFWSAFFFALIHLRPLQAVPAFVNGVVWALVLLRTGSLGATLFLHSLNNGAVFLLVQVAMLAERGMLGGTPVMETPPVLKAALVLSVGLLGLSLVLRAFRELPRAPARLAAFWALPRIPGREAPPALAAAQAQARQPGASGGRDEPPGPGAVSLHEPLRRPPCGPRSGETPPGTA